MHSHQSGPATNRIVTDRPAAPPKPLRIDYLDNLRAIAMLLGVYLHAALAYASPAQTIWLATDSQSSILVDASIWLIHLFRLSLFFLLAGYFAKLIIEQKGIQSFLLSRIVRIGVPFVIFYPFLWAAMAAIFIFAASYNKNPSGLMGLILETANNTADGAAGKSRGSDATSPGTMHLWFLYYLLGFVALTPVLSKLRWINFNWLFTKPACWLLLPLALVPAVLAARVPLPAPESFVPALWPFAFYGIFYWLGWQLKSQESVLERLNRFLAHILLGSSILFIAYYLHMPRLELRTLESEYASRTLTQNLIDALLTACLSVSLTFGSLLLGRRFLQHRNTVLKIIADSSYWIYLIHLPIVLFLQTLLIPLAWPPLLKLATVIIGTLLPCFATYFVFVRYTPLGWLLHGKRSFP